MIKYVLFLVFGASTFLSAQDVNYYGKWYRYQGDREFVDVSFYKTYDQPNYKKTFLVITQHTGTQTYGEISESNPKLLVIETSRRRIVEYASSNQMTVYWGDGPRTYFRPGFEPPKPPAVKVLSPAQRQKFETLKATLPSGTYQYRKEEQTASSNIRYGSAEAAAAARKYSSSSSGRVDIYSFFVKWHGDYLVIENVPLTTSNSSQYTSVGVSGSGTYTKTVGSNTGSRSEPENFQVYSVFHALDISGNTLYNSKGEVLYMDKGTDGVFNANLLNNITVITNGVEVRPKISGVALKYSNSSTAGAKPFSIPPNPVVEYYKKYPYNIPESVKPMLGGLSGAATSSISNASTANQVKVVDQLDAGTQTAKIHDATRNLDYTAVEKLIKEEGADPNVKDGAKGRTAVHYAAMNGDRDSREIVELLVKQSDADINVIDKEGKTALDLALEKGNFEMAKVLLNNSANAKLANEGLDRILATNETELLRLFLQNGADANVAMNKSIEVDNVEMLNVVLDNSSARPTNQMFEKAVDLRSQQTAVELLVRGIDKDQAMDFVIEKKDKPMVELVLSTNTTVESTNKALVFAAEQRDMQLTQMTIEQYYANPTVGMAPAVTNNHMQMVQYLLQKGADPNDQMDEAAAQGKVSIVEALLMYGASADLGVVPAATNLQIAVLQTLFDANGDANLAMPIAIDKGDVRIVNMCISAPNAADVYRTEYIVTTCEKSNLDILNALLMAGADPNPGMPISVGKKDAKMVRELIQAGANVNRAEYLSTSIQNQDDAVTGLLLDNGADATAPQFIAKSSELGLTTITKMLLDKGADPNNGMGKAVSANKSQVVSILLERGADGSKDVYMSSSARHNNPLLTQQLIDAGGNPQIALLPAVDANADKVLTVIQKAGVDITDDNLLATCVRKNYIASAKVIVNAGATAANWFDAAKGQNLIHVAIVNHMNAQMVKLLADAGADIDAKTTYGDSPLHLAVYQAKDKTDMVEMMVLALISLGADVNAVNAKDETVLKASPNKRQVNKHLRDAGAEKRVK